MLNFLRRHADAFALCALALVCAFVFWPLVNGQTFYFGDLQLYFQPMASLWAGALEEGRVPLWNAGILGGTPFVGSPQMWLLYPSALLFLVFPAVKALAVTTLVHFWMAGAFFYGWTRRGRLKLRALPAFLGACVWMLCGFVVAKSQFPNMLQAIAWVPAALWASERVAARADARGTLILSLVLALQLLAAHAQISLLCGYMMALYAFHVWRAVPSNSTASGVSPSSVSPSSVAASSVAASGVSASGVSASSVSSARPRGWRVAASFAGAFVLVGLLTLGQTLPIVEALGATARQRLDLVDASRFSVIPWAIGTLILPYFYGNPMQGHWDYPIGINLWESVCYVGLVPLGLAVVALKGEPRAKFWAGWTLGFLWLSMGVWGGLWALAYYGLPGIARFHDAGRLLVGFSLGGALLSALGAQWLLKQRNGARWAALALALTLLDLGVFARGFYPTALVALASSAPTPLWGADEMMDSRQGRVWMLAADAVWAMFQPISDMRPGDAANTRRFFATYTPNRHLVRGWLAETGYEPMYDRATQKRILALDLKLSTGKFPPKLAEQLARNSVRVLQLPRETPLPATPEWTLVGASEPPINGLRVFCYRNEKCLPRARFRADDKAWQRARIVGETASWLTLQVPASARMVELADSMRPGWSASVDGAPLAIETTVEGWRRLQLPSSAVDKARTVRFEYAPQPWKLGTFVSLCALGFWCAAMMATRVRNR